MKNRILGLSLSIMLPPLGETAVPFPWRPVPEHLANLLGIGELLSVGDPPQSQMGQLPQPLGQTNLRMAQWFDLCSTTELFFIETVEVMETITPTLCMWDMHALMHQVCEIARLKRPPCFKIWNGTPTNMAAQPQGCPCHHLTRE